MCRIRFNDKSFDLAANESSTCPVPVIDWLNFDNVRIGLSSAGRSLAPSLHRPQKILYASKWKCDATIVGIAVQDVTDLTCFVSNGWSCSIIFGTFVPLSFILPSFPLFLCDTLLSFILEGLWIESILERVIVIMS